MSRYSMTGLRGRQGGQRYIWPSAISPSRGIDGWRHPDHRPRDHWRVSLPQEIVSREKSAAWQECATTDGLRKEIAETEAKLAANEARLEKDFPDYAARANPKPLTIEETHQRTQTSDSSSEPCIFGNCDNRAHILVRAGCGDTSSKGF
jgi:hypothetical protein